MPQVRDVIRDNHQREGIVIERDKRPTAAWIRDQKDRRVASVPEEEIWWRVLPFDGGSVLVPDSLATWLRSATYDDVMKAVEGANQHGRRELAFVFPEILEAAHRRQTEKKEANQSITDNDGAAPRRV